MKEFVIGLDTEKMFESLRAAFWRRYGRDQDDLPTGVVSFGTESVPCNISDLARIASNPVQWVSLESEKGDTNGV